MVDAPAQLVFRDIELVYRSKRGTLQALNDLTLAVKPGEFVCVLGPSGCGKSTLLKIAAGLILPTAGEATLAGTPITRPRADVGVVFQKASLMPWKTVLENILVTPRALKLDIEKSKATALDLLSTVGLEGFAKNYPGELSGGMQQRVGLARGLIHDPNVLLMDEPFAALDAMTRELMTLELQRLWLTTHKSVLFITHSIPEAVFLADRIVVLSERPGHVVKAIEVQLPRPRSIDTMAAPEFVSLCNELREHFSSSLTSS